MKNLYLVIILSFLLLIGCSTTPKIPSEALIGQWKDTFYPGASSTYYFGKDGEFILISPIGGYFNGTYDVVVQNPTDKSLELKTIDKIPGSIHYFHRRLKGKLSENDHKFSGEILSSIPKNTPFVLEYIDDRQIPPREIIDWVIKNSYIKQSEAEEAMVANFKNLEKTREEARVQGKKYAAEIKELKSQIEKLNNQLEEMHIKLKEKEQDISVSETIN
jgi:hypothetical protein